MQQNSSKTIIALYNVHKYVYTELTLIAQTYHFSFCLNVHFQIITPVIICYTDNMGWYSIQVRKEESQGFTRLGSFLTKDLLG